MQAKAARRSLGGGGREDCDRSYGWQASRPVAAAVSIEPRRRTFETFSMPTIKKIGVLTGGGDAPGLNAVIRAVVKAAHNSNVQVVGLEDSFDGLIYPEKSRILTPRDCTGILRLGGTVLGTRSEERRVGRGCGCRWWR